MANSRYNTPGNSDAAAQYLDLLKRIETLERRAAGSSQPVVVATSAPFAAQAAPLGANTKAANSVLWINPADNNAMSVFSDQGTWDPVGDLTVVGDGIVPNNAPVVSAVGGVGFLHIRITVATVNPSPVTYKYHISTTTGFTPDPTTLAIMTPGTAATIKTMPDGSPLLYGVTYYIVVIPSDSDGDGPASTEVSVQLVQVTNPDISAAYAYLGHLVVDQLTGGTLSADMLLAAMISNRPGSTGGGVDIDTTGISIYDALGTLATTLQPDLSKFKGAGEFNSLTVTGPAAFRDQTQVAQGSSVILRENTTAPVAPPAVIVEWPGSLTLSGVFAGTYGLCWTGSDWATVNDSAAPVIHRSISSDVVLPAGAPHPWGGVTKIGTDWYTLGWTKPLGGPYSWKITRYDSTGVQQTQVTYTNINSADAFDATAGGDFATGLGVAAIGTDGTNLLVAEFDNTNDRFRIQTRNPSTLIVASTLNTSAQTGFNGPVVGVSQGSYDLGVNRIGILVKNAVVVWTFDNTGTYQPNDTFPVGGSGTGTMSGFDWDGTRFWTTRAKYASSGPQVFKHTTNKWTGASTKNYYATSTWRDTNATGGTHETDMGPVATFTMKKRAAVTLTSPIIPNNGGTDDADSVSFYVGETNTTRTNLWKQTDPALGVNTATYGDGIAFSGTNPPAANNFPNATVSGILKTGAVDGSSNPLFQVNGAGTISRGPDTGSVLTQLLQAACSTNVDLTTTEADITGATLTFNTTRANARVLCIGVFYFSATGTNANVAAGKLSVDGTTQTATATFTGDTAVPNRGTYTQVWIPTLASAGAHTLKLRGSVPAGTGVRVNSVQTTITVVVFE